MYIQTIDHQGLGLVTANKQPKPTEKNKLGQNNCQNPNLTSTQGWI